MKNVAAVGHQELAGQALARRYLGRGVAGLTIISVFRTDVYYVANDMAVIALLP